MRKTIYRYIFRFLLLAVMLALLLPLVFMFAGSFMSASEVEYAYGGAYSGFASGGFARLVFVPRLFTLEQYGQVLLNSPDYLYAYWNSISLLLPTLAGLMIVAPLAGFSLAKFRYRGITVVTSVYILLALLPYHTMIVPNYIMLYRLNLLNTRASVWLTQIFHPLAVFIIGRIGLPIAILTFLWLLFYGYKHLPDCKATEENIVFKNEGDKKDLLIAMKIASHTDYKTTANIYTICVTRCSGRRR